MAKNGFTWVKPQATSGPHWELAAGSTPDEKKWLIYYGDNQPEFENLDFLPEGKKYSVHLLNAWNTEEDTDLKIVIDKDTTFRIPRKKYRVLLLTEEN